MFWSFCNNQQGNAKNIPAYLINFLNGWLNGWMVGKLNILPGAHDKQKLAANVMKVPQCWGSKEWPAQGCTEHYKGSMPNSHYVHCFDHQLNLVLQQVTSQIDAVRVFFAHHNAFSIFLYHSPKRVSYIDNCVAIRIPRSVQTRWNFESNCFYCFWAKDDLKECCKRITNTWKKDKAFSFFFKSSPLDWG